MAEPRSYLLDTSVVSELCKKKPGRRVIDWIAARPEHTLYLSLVTLGEINKGIAMLPDGDPRRDRIREWLQRDLRARFGNRILGISEEVILRWGEIDGQAERKGRQIPVVDGLIAATAVVAGVVVASRNEEHIRRGGAEVFNPWKSVP